MNLVEIAECSGRTVDELKDILLTHFSRIVLSEYSQLDNKVIQNLMDFLQIDKAAILKFDASHERLAGELTDEGPRRAGSKKKGFVNNQIRGFKNAHASHKDENPNTTGDVLSEDERLLQELNQIEAPGVNYTKKLIRYCFEQKYLMFIDTCSLLNDSFYDFYDIFSGAIAEPPVLYVPYVVIEELKSIRLKKEKEQELLTKAEDRIGFIAQQCQKNRMRIVGDEDDKRTNERGEKVIHADRILIEKLIYFRNDSKSCLLITQDHGVTVDALKQNDWQSSKSNAQIIVKKIGKGGILVDNSEDARNPALPID